MVLLNYLHKGIDDHSIFLKLYFPIVLTSNQLMRILFLTISVVLLSKSAFTQNKTFAVGTTTPNSNAVMDVDAPNHNQGVLLPRLTTIQRNAMVLTTLDVGLIVYDTDIKGTITWNGTSWGGTIGGFSSTVNPAVSGTTSGTGTAGYFQNTNASNINPSLYATTNGAGNGIAIRGDVTNAVNAAAAVYGSTVGTGVGLYGITTGNGAGIQGYTATGTTAIYGQHNGASGNAGIFSITNASSNSPVLNISHSGTGYGISSNAPIVSNNIGTNSLAGAFFNINATNTQDALYAQTNGAGNSLATINLGTGRAAYLGINNASNSSIALEVTTNGTGTAAKFTNTNTNSTGPLIYAEMNSTTSNAAMEVLSNGTSGHAGVFNIFNSANPQPALFSFSQGTGPTLQIHHGNGGNALEVGNGGIKLSSTTISGGGAITQLVAIYRITTTSAITLPNATDGQICWVLNDAGGVIDITNAGLTEPIAGNVAQYVYIGQWRQMQ